jgi:two-component system sensor kinase
LWGQGQALNFHGVVLLAASRFEECIEKCHEAVEVLERAGDLWEVNVARVHTSFALFRSGDLVACEELAHRVHYSGVELGDAQASGFSLDVWAQSTGGRLPPEVLQTELKRHREDVQVRCQVMLAEGVRLFMLGDAEQAADVFEQAQGFANVAGVQNAYVLPLRSWLASALRRQAETTCESDGQTRRTVLKRAAKVASKAVRVGRKFRNDLPHALRECGLIAAMQGNARKACKFLDESLAVAESQGARFEHAQTLLARGQIGQRHEWPEAKQDLTLAQQSLRDLGADFVLDAAARS